MLLQETVVQQLLAVVARRSPLRAAKPLLSEQVALFIDDKPIAQGVGAWLRWVDFLHRQADKKMSALDICIDTIRTEGEYVHITAHWQAHINGTVRESSPAQVSYRVCNNKVVEIKTHRRNYSFIHGAGMAKSWLLFYALLLYMKFMPPPTALYESPD